MQLGASCNHHNICNVLRPPFSSLPPLRYTDSSFHGERYTLDGKTYDKLGNIDPVTGRECSDCGPAGYYYTQVGGVVVIGLQ
jgi:hypothetical protein